MAELEEGGFQFKEASLWGVFNPRWTLKRSRGAFKLQAEKVGTCAVIGAGLAGASVVGVRSRPVRL